MTEPTFYAVGLGAMGIGVARLLSDRGWCGIGATSHQVGQALAEIVPGSAPGARIRADLDDGAVADLCVIATASTVEQVHDQVLWAIGRGMNVLSSAEQLVYPWRTAADRAEEIHRAAVDAGVSVLGTGINPGFVMDVLPVMAGLAAVDVRRVHARRVNDLSEFGPTVLASFGIGLSEHEFHQAVAAGNVSGHVGFVESVHLLADAFGWVVDRVQEQMTPIIATEQRRAGTQVVTPGMVVGANQSIAAYTAGVCEPVITLEHPQQIDPGAAGIATGDFLEIEADPRISLQIVPEITGGIGTMAVMTNMADALVRSSPGLVTMLDFVPVLSRRRNALP